MASQAKLEGSATILHADLDAFYASVEQVLDPALGGRPIAVGGGVVLAASYEARAFGVRGGMGAGEALRLCPALQFVEGHFDKYQSLAEEVMSVFTDFTPFVERISIDEAWLDVAGAGSLFGLPEEIAASIRRRVRQETGLPVSIGVARTKHLAKIGSQVAKPDGLVVIEPSCERLFLEQLPVELIWGVGPVTRRHLADLGIHTIGQLAATRQDRLEQLLGAAVGAKLWSLSSNVDPRQIDPPRPASSVGAQAALGRRQPTEELVRSTLCYLADRAGARLRATRRAGRTVTARVRFADMRSATRALTVRRPVSATLTLTELAEELVGGALADHPEERFVTLLGVSVGKLVATGGIQLELPFATADRTWVTEAPKGVSRLSLDESIDAVRRRYGHEAIDYAVVRFSGGPRVSDAFRQLAARS